MIKLIEIDNDVRVFIVGDIHGMYLLLMSELDRLGFDKRKDLLISVGDLVDRGPQCEKVLSLLNEDWFICIKGNHEQFCELGFLNSSIEYNHKASNNGGSWFYKLSTELQQYFVNQFKKLPVLLEVHYNNKKFGFIHADVPIHDWEQLKEELKKDRVENKRHISDLCLWSRRLVYEDDVHIEGIDHVFLGHTVLSDIKQVGNCTFLDTGAVFTKKLSIVELSTYL